MRKTHVFVLIFFLISIVFSASSSLAESFELRNGITFNSSREEIKAKEQLPLQREAKKWIRFGPGTIAGIENSTVEYDFNDENHMTNIHISLNLKQSQFGWISAFNDVNLILQKKYGDPIDLDFEEMYPYRGKGAETLEQLIEVTVAFGGSYEYLYNEWAIETDEGLIKIEHYSMVSVSKSGKNTDANHSLVYTLFDTSSLDQYKDDI